MQRSGAAALVGASAGAVAGAVVDAVVDRRGSGEARWAARQGGPDAEATLVITMPAGSPSPATLSLKIQTPQGLVTRNTGEVALKKGRNEVTVDLAYPFDDIVPGDYHYTAVIQHSAGARLESADAISYTVSPFLWFS